MTRPFHLFAALGFTSTAGQILLMRELIVVFYGNEVSLGIMLAGWLFWVGLGSLLAAQLAPRFRWFSRVPALALLQGVLGLATLGSLLCVRALPLLLGRGSAGEIVGYVPIVVSSFLVVAPTCLLLGLLFDLFCHVWSNEDDAATSIGSVYLFEALGAAVGGVAFAWLLVRTLDPLRIACALLILNLLASSAMLWLARRLKALAAAASLLTVVAAVPVFFEGAGRLHELSLGWLWQDLDVVYTEDSIYGNIAFIEEEEQKSLYQNGLLMFSHPDRFAAEEAVHFALLEHAAPVRALLIGGGVSGSLNEVLKHPVESVEYLEIDPLVIRMAKRFFPADISEVLEDSRVSVRTVDGRLFVKRIAADYDVIIVNLPDPYTALINRFYTLEFFRECTNAMAPGGILSLRVSSAEHYISPELQQFLGCLDLTLRQVFPDVKVVPGETNIFLACKEPGILTLDSDELVGRLEARGIKEDLLFIREYYVPFRLSEDRKERLASALATAEARINTDLAPVCYYYDAVLWSKQFKDVSAEILASFSRVRPYWIAAAIAGAFGIALLIQRVFPLGWGQKSILVAVGTTGFAEMTIEVVTLLGFQAIHGYVYYKVAIIITCFMIGLTAGAAAMGRLMKSGGVGRRAFLLIQTVVCLYPLLTLGALLAFSRMEPSDTSVHALVLQTQIAFPMLAFFAGFVGGLQFPLANALWLEETPGAARAAGYTYGIDLLGSCLGALLTSTLLVPVLGIPHTCVAASLLNVGSLLLLLLRPTVR
jgi:spermidine synthase